MSDVKPHIDDHQATQPFFDGHEVLWGHVSAILGTEELAEARRALAAISEMLPAHLVLEEGPGGVFDAMREASDLLDDVLERLVIDHRRIRRIMVKLPMLAGKPEEMAEIKSFARYLEVHEARERAAMEVARGGVEPTR